MLVSLYKTGDLDLLNIACYMFFCWNQWNLEISATLWKPNLIRYPHGRHGACGYTAPACRTHPWSIIHPCKVRGFVRAGLYPHEDDAGRASAASGSNVHVHPGSPPERVQ